MRIAIGGDHASYSYKPALIAHMQEMGHEVTDYGTFSEDSVDYPDFALPVTAAVVEKRADRGILICYTGIGMSMSANKVHGIRCALCGDLFSAKLTRAHNDTNVLAMGAGVIGLALAKEIVSVWLDTEFEGGGRHQRRIQKVMGIEA